MGQSFSEEIDGIPILVNFGEVVVEPFDGTQDPHIHLQFTANKVKRLKIANFFNIWQAKDESLKSYLD
ncbi:hypothetical protein CR513_25300, partial [Mucuna pruriens]